MPQISYRKILLHPATLFVTCVILIVVGTVTLWEQNSQHFLKSNRFQLTSERISVRGARDDLTHFLKEAIVEELVTEESNTLDTQLVARVASFVESRPYVKASFVKKSVSNLQIEAAFRQPVGIVELGTMPIAVDAEGVLLDGRIYQMKSPDDFLRISVDRPVNQGLQSWQSWPDPRIVRAAQICNELEGVWQELELYRVVTYWRPGQEPQDSDVFELWTKYGDGGKIIWSTAADPSQDVSVDEKIHLLRQFVAQKGPLRKLAGRNKLDVRSGKAILTKDVRTARQLDWLKSSDRHGPL